MIVFDGEQAAKRSLNCGAGLLDEMARWTAERKSAGLPSLGTGIGLHWGEVFLGVIGDQDRLEFSVFGDAVNIAARLESLTRDLEMDLIVSNDLVTAARGPGLLDGLVSIPPIEVKGRSGALELLGVPIRSENAKDHNEDK